MIVNVVIFLFCNNVSEIDVFSLERMMLLVVSDMLLYKLLNLSENNINYDFSVNFLVIR